ncbi:hypothetical protein QE439_001216 [Pedobacter agri]|nr:hypothetical protein [Pedobacter agri]
MNILIKLMSIVSLVIAPYIAVKAVPTEERQEVRKEIRIEQKTDASGNIINDTLMNTTDTLAN